ncbi:uncharacterized protein [Venturia canescens]|nr:uncharacterized protein LOC122406904 isoform X2 [Venturia canescens]XP_043268649.1 uncharacterized protein LOC122406904 isoform X2 [Venturia canescens]XP_043268650.1 uncharacterized protein LOC122406904 isoform X2 [Venturia canescens]XP_043268652.1 uncharacterized protein LOC122406904 isoform X2 [Venturia canescens]XP_043268653.1 uncharacterized protein LOC122406904 isoform X2 [Venturia canescens]
MDLHTSHYLEAIQAISGCTPGQKYTQLNAIAQKAVTEAKSHGDVATPLFCLDEVPKPLESLVRLKIAKILRQNEVVAEALRSEDRELVDLALRTKWFFRGNNKEVINVEYFKTNLYPLITLNTRMKIIKRLSMRLKTDGETTLAEEFYDFTCQTYGKRQAEPLFVACSESFIWKTVIEQKIILSRRIVKTLFDKFPELVIRYLKLSKPDDERATERNLHCIDIYKYTFFLPRLIKNHLKSLIELIEMHKSCLGMKLSNKATERFLKGNVDVVLDAPILYKSMMPLKVIAAKVTKSQYERMFAKIYPLKSNDFRYYQVEEYLVHYPEQERIPLLLETYKQVYNASMLDNHDIIGKEILKMLPTDERVRQARIKLKKEPDWHSTGTVDKMWRCYLPLEETITSIKQEISKTSSADERSKLLQQMFFACSINDDKETLLEILRYFTTRHKNERTCVIFEVLNSFMYYSVTSMFGKDHWSVLYEFVKFLNVKHELTENAGLSIRILTAFIYFNLSHDLSIDESIEILIELNMIAWNAEWCIFEKYPEYDRLCFDKMMSLLPRKYLENDKVWSTHGVDAMKNIAKSMGNFNERNANKSNSTKMEKLSMKNYPWLLGVVEKSLKTMTKKSEWRFDEIIGYLKKWEVDLYEKWIPAEFDALADVETGQVLKILKAEPSKILTHFDEYWNAIINIICGKRIARRFVKASRWYQDLPMRFLARSLASLSTNETDQSLIILAILMTGSEYASVIEPLIPKDEKTIDTDKKDAKSNYWKTQGIPRAMNLVNPPVPLSLVMNFCDGDFLTLGLTSLFNVSRRTSVDKVQKFAKQLTDCRVSVKKHGIRLFCLVATITDYRDFLISLWKMDKHRSIRVVIFENIFNFLFPDNPCPENWIVLRDCLIDLGIEDDEIFDIINNFNLIPDAYFAEYMSHLLATLERLEASSLSAAKMVPRINSFLRGITPAMSLLLTEEFLEKLVKKYFCNPMISSDLADAGMTYTLNAYLRADPNKLDSRLQIFSNIYTDILRQHWDKPDSEVPPRFPINCMTHRFVHNHVCCAGVDLVNVKIMKTILESFLRVLKPQQDWTTYALLAFGVGLQGVKDSTSVAQSIVNTLPHFVEIFSSVLVIELAEIVKKWILIVSDTNFYDDVLHQVIDTLCRVSTSDSCTLAAKLLFLSSVSQNNEWRNSLLEFLLRCPYPVATSLAYQHANTSWLNED